MHQHQLLVGLSICLIVALPFAAFPQIKEDSSIARSNLSEKLTGKYIGDISAKSGKISSDIDRQSGRYLDQLQKQEAKIEQRLAKVDSLGAKKIFANSARQYQQIQTNIKNKSQALLTSCGKYIPWTDTALTSLKFLQQNALLSKMAGKSAQIQAAISKVQVLENEFKQADNIKEFIRQRKAYLTQELANYSLGDEIKNYNTQAYYFSQQINQYREAWNNPAQMESKAVELLNKLPVFQAFMKKNSMLAGLFDVPGDYGSASGVAGLQTRDQTEQLVKQKITTMGANGAQTAQANIQSAQSQIASLRNKLNQFGSGGGDVPENLQPNTQKTKTLLSRLEYGINVQSTHSTYFFPMVTNFGLSLGYKLNDKGNSIGIGATYIMGWGPDIRHIALSSQGIGFRSFLNIQMKKNFFASGGLEYNYEQPFSSYQDIRNIQLWQSSGLIGISKIISIKSKLFKKTTIQVFWDFLSYQNIPQTQPFIFRYGYTF
jgi:hypothetical protein